MPVNANVGVSPDVNRWMASHDPHDQGTDAGRPDHRNGQRREPRPIWWRAKTAEMKKATAGTGLAFGACPSPSVG
jgi:hypothetical protein